MLKLEVEINEIDYNLLIEKYLPIFIESLQKNNMAISSFIPNGLSSSIIKNIVTKLNYEQKNKLVADLINSNSIKISEKITEIAQKNDIVLTIDSLKAEVD